jgi:hypothetical protein
VRTLHGIPLTSPILTLVALATRLSRRELETAVNEADKHDLIKADALAGELRRLPRHPGLARLRRLIDRQAFVLTDSELERLFLSIASAAGLPLPLTGCFVSGSKVDFFWPDLGLVVETDGLRRHRTPAEQARDRERDQAQTAAGLTPLRFTHAQIRFDPDRVRRILRATASRLDRARNSRS